MRLNENAYTLKDPDELAGVTKKSFTIDYNGGQIWFEHLDGMYQYTDLVLEKFENDSSEFLRPSSTSFVAVMLFETQITAELIDLLVEKLFLSERKFRKIAFIGLPVRWHFEIKKANLMASGTAVTFMDDTQKAKEWLLP